MKVVLELRFGYSKCHFFGLKDGQFWQKRLLSDHKKWHFGWPDQNSMNTFIVYARIHVTKKSIFQNTPTSLQCSAQRVPEPDPLPEISFDTRPDPIQF